MTKRIVVIRELDELSKIQFAPFKYDAQIWSTVDDGETYYHCGASKWFETLEEAEKYKKQIEK